MAKIRVYELAKDLSMKNKALLEKIKELNISVRSHMSSLEDETVARIKAFIGGKTDEFADGRGDKLTIIRRPKKLTAPTSEESLEDVAPDPEIADEAPDTETVPASAAPGEPIADTTMTTQDEAPTSAAIREMEAVEKIETEAESNVTAALSDNNLPSVAEEPILTDSLPESASELPGAAQLAAEPGSVAAQTAIAAEAIAGSDDLQLEKITSETIKENNLKSAETLAISIEEPMELAAPSVLSTENNATNLALPLAPESEVISIADQDGFNKKTIKGKKKGKKPKKDMPAKIIKLPAPTVEVKLEKPAIIEKKEPVVELPELEIVEAIPAVNDVSELDKKKKKWKKEEGDTEKGVRWTKKKPLVKRKEVIIGEDIYADRGRKSKKGSKGKQPPPSKTIITTPKAIKRRIQIDDTIIIADLAKRMGIKANEMIAKLMTLGVMVTVNQTIDFDTAVLVASEFNYEVERASFNEEVILRIETDEPEQMLFRAPVVTIMGHVDHGKTSLLDVIRRTRITELEAGGITQHIGAYYVTTKRGQIAFLDTPGHEAFTAMRARGAKVTDIVVLVVAADDGVMPQTVEAINHAKASEVPIIVAVNKMDKPGADPDKVYRELANHGLSPEDWGGDTIFVKVSAKMKQGIDELLEMILLQSEVLELKANPNKLARGYVVESKLDSGRGPVATILVQEGTLHAGDAIVCGIHHGKIRALLDDCGLQVESAGPSIPVEVLGLTGVPNAGDELIALPDEKSAKQVSVHRAQKQRSVELAKTSRMSLERLFEKMKKGEVKDLNLIIKADVHGSIEALKDSLVKLSNEEVSINVVHAATGTVTESDVSLAAVSNAIIIGFNVRPTAKVQNMAVEEHVDMRFYNIIYNVIKEVKDAILGMMASKYEERVVGRAEVREVFHVPKIGAIAGSYIQDGKIERNRLARVLRDGVVTFDGKLGSLRRFKDDVKEVLSGYECGIGIENFNDIKVGDIIECYYLEEVKPVY